jgi:hypothetical protein
MKPRNNKRRFESSESFEFFRSSDESKESEDYSSEYSDNDPTESSSHFYYLNDTKTKKKITPQFLTRGTPSTARRNQPVKDPPSNPNTSKTRSAGAMKRWTLTSKGCLRTTSRRPLSHSATIILPSTFASRKAPPQNFFRNGTERRVVGQTQK